MQATARKIWLVQDGETCEQLGIRITDYNRQDRGQWTQLVEIGSKLNGRIGHAIRHKRK